MRWRARTRPCSPTPAKRWKRKRTSTSITRWAGAASCGSSRWACPLSSLRRRKKRTSSQRSAPRRPSSRALPPRWRARRARSRTGSSGRLEGRPERRHVASTHLRHAGDAVKFARFPKEAPGRDRRRMPYKIPMHPACRRLPWNVNGSWGGHAVRWARRLQGSDARTREAADAQADDGRRSRGDPATSGGSSELFRVAADVPLAAAGRSRCASRSREETQALARTARAAGRMLQAQGLLVRPNACAERNRENATMVRLTADGGERAVFASGLRNTIGFGWHPGSRRMWGLDHGIDWLGD